VLVNVGEWHHVMGFDELTADLAVAAGEVEAADPKGARASSCPKTRVLQTPEPHVTSSDPGIVVLGRSVRLEFGEDELCFADRAQVDPPKPHTIALTVR